MLKTHYTQELDIINHGYLMKGDNYYYFKCKLSIHQHQQEPITFISWKMNNWGIVLSTWGSAWEEMTGMHVYKTCASQYLAVCVLQMYCLQFLHLVCVCVLMVHTPCSASSCLRQQPRIMKKLLVQDLFYLFLKSHTPNNCNRTLTCKREVVIVGDLHVGQLEPLPFSSLWLEKLGSWSHVVSFGCAVSPVPCLASQGKTPLLWSFLWFQSGLIAIQIVNAL